MICLTGDLHHQSLGTGNQRHCEMSEVRVAHRYLDLLRDAGVKVTFFVSGLALRDQWNELAPIVRDPLVELGGHNFDCFTPALPHRLWNKVAKSYPGPAWMERRDVLRTLAIIRQRTGRPARLWRNHMYKHGPSTNRILAESGVWACSDTVSADARGPTWTEEGILDVPINVMPDHEHLFHAERTPEWVERWQRRYRWSDAFGARSYRIEEWTEIVLDQLRRNEERGATTTMIIHPITMWLCDRFRSMTRIVDYLSSRKTPHLGEVVRASLQSREAGPVDLEVAS